MGLLFFFVLDSQFYFLFVSLIGGLCLGFGYRLLFSFYFEFSGKVKFRVKGGNFDYFF